MKFRILLLSLGFLLIAGTSFAMDPVIDLEDQMEVLSVDQDIVEIVNLDLCDRGDVHGGILMFDNEAMILINDIKRIDDHGHVALNAKANERTTATKDDQRSETMLSLFYIPSNIDNLETNINLKYTFTSGGLPKVTNVI